MRFCRQWNPGSMTAGTVMLVLWLVSGTATAQWPVALNDGGRPSLSPLLEKVTPAVVNISVTGRRSVQRNPLFEDPFFRRFFDVPEQQQQQSVPTQAVGSGVIVDADKGYVITNHHVIENADKITVTLQDRRRFDAKLIGSDSETDIALLQIDANHLTAIKLGDSQTLKVGDFVVAIGNPFGLGQTVTSGIVSAVGRSGLNIEGYEDFIQTDASINPGNSGGALIDLNGDLVGINTAILAPSGGNVGIGFAVPVHMVRAVMDQLVEYGEVHRGQLGIVIQNVTPDLADALKLGTNEGAVITQVQPGSPAEKAGLKAGDVVTAVDDEAVTSSTALRNTIGLMRVGKTVELTVIRDGKQRKIKATIGEPQNGNLSAGAGAAPSLDKLDGAEFRNLGPGDPGYGQVQGVLVAQVEQGSPAASNGLREGDVILAVNRQAVGSVDELSTALGQAGPTVALDVLRGNVRLFIVIR